MLGAEGGSTKEEVEGAQAMEAVVGMESGFQVDFVVAAGAGEGAAVVETPDAAVGEDAPADAPVRVDVGGGKIAEDLAVRRTGLVACVERQIEAFALGDGQGVGVSFGGGFGGGKVFGFGIAEEQMIGDVFVVVAALLGQIVSPTEQFEEGPDQLLLGGGLVDGVEVGGILDKGLRLSAEGVEVCGLGQGFLPGVGVEDAFFEEVVGEKLTGHCKGLVAGALVCG